MYSKYILNSNWSSLSGSYTYDKEVTLKNQKIYVDGNLDVNYLPFLSVGRDVVNNNYSYLFLTKSSEIKNYIDFNEKIENLQSQTCLIVSNFEDKKIIDETVFLTLESNSYVFKDVSRLDQTCFLEFYKISETELILYRIEKEIYYYFSIDPFTESLFSLSSFKAPKDFSQYDKDKIKLNFLYFNKNENICLYRYFNNNFLFFKNIDNVLSIKKSQVPDMTDKGLFFALLSVKNLPNISPKTNWISYKRGSNLNNLNVESSRSFYDIKNNFLFHFEYLKDNDLNLNTLTLKNQLNYKDNTMRVGGDSYNLRDYTSIFGGGNREHGFDNISLSYSSNYTIYDFLSDKTTWFRLPNVKEKTIININETEFFENGAIAGRSPLYSDKIWKKNTPLSYTSNLGESSFKEHTGQWLCAWLSGGDDNGMWMNRFYNPDVFTPFEAIKFAPNVDYRPQYYGKYPAGIYDIPSDLIIESGGWYAYSRMGIKSAKNIISSQYPNLISKDLQSFKDYNNNDVYFERDRDGDASYNFDGGKYGTVSLREYRNNYNNFTLSFFASRENWDVSREYQLLGNYLNDGFGFFNCEDINPVLYTFDNNKSKITFHNNEAAPILEIDVTRYVSLTGNPIVGVFYRSLLENFLLVTSLGIVLEFTSNGTLVETLCATNDDNIRVISCNNNDRYGVVCFSDSTTRRINLFDKTHTTYSNNDLKQFGIINTEIKTIIDNNDRIFLTCGVSPIIKNDRIYYLDTDNVIKFYSIENETITDYLTGTENVVDYNFDRNGNTHVLYTSSYEVYDAIGVLNKKVEIDTKSSNISAFPTNIGIIKVDDKDTSLITLEGDNSFYFYNTESKEFKKISQLNQLNFSNLKYDFCFDKYLQSTKRNVIKVPIYRVKIKLQEIVNTEKFIVLESVILGDSLGTGEHHFVVALDTVKGVFRFYIDKKLYSEKNFTPGKYSFSNILRENFIVGTIPFYGNIPYNNFYKTTDKNFYLNDFTLRNFKFFNTSFTHDEVNMLYLEKKGTKTLTTKLMTGNRSYMDTISRVFKNKVPGKKSNLINLYISNTKISDKAVQNMYNNVILSELKEILPGHVKINKINWLENKDGGDKMLQGFFNRKISITEN
jgi:hypothetical protein